MCACRILWDLNRREMARKQIHRSTIGGIPIRSFPLTAHGGALVLPDPPGATDNVERGAQCERLKSIAPNSFAPSRAI